VRVLRELQMATAFQLAGRAAGEDDRQRAEIVLVRRGLLGSHGLWPSPSRGVHF
jgi:hypothetical protein